MLRMSHLPKGCFSDFYPCNVWKLKIRQSLTMLDCIQQTLICTLYMFRFHIVQYFLNYLTSGVCIDRFPYYAIALSIYGGHIRFLSVNKRRSSSGFHHSKPLFKERNLQEIANFLQYESIQQLRLHSGTCSVVLFKCITIHLTLRKRRKQRKWSPRLFTSCQLITHSMRSQKFSINKSISHYIYLFSYQQI